MYNIRYLSPDGFCTYCVCDMPTKAEALKVLEQFKARYLNPDGTGKVYPNGRGTYPFSNPTVVKVPIQR